VVYTASLLMVILVLFDAGMTVLFGTSTVQASPLRKRASFTLRINPSPRGNRRIMTNN